MYSEQVVLPLLLLMTFQIINILGYLSDYSLEIVGMMRFSIFMLMMWKLKQKALVILMLLNMFVEDHGEINGKMLNSILHILAQVLKSNSLHLLIKVPLMKVGVSVMLKSLISLMMLIVEVIMQVILAG